VSVAVASPPSPYKGLAPFDDSDFDALLFFGREVESEVIAANLIASRITVLYGPSGVGKSSVLRAGVAHRLRQDDDLDVVVFSTWTGDPVSALIEEIGAGGDSLVEAVEAGAEQAGGDLYMVLDQFEEYFLYHPPGEEFGSELAGILSSPGLRVNVLLGMREDSLARLDALKATIPNLLGNRLRLERLNADAGRAAILGPVERCNTLVSPADPVAIEPDLVDDILHQVTVGRVELSGAGRGVAAAVDENLIEAPFLQLVLARLWDIELERGSRTLRRETLRELGGAQRIVENHLERAMAELSPAEKGAAAAMYHFLVTPSGTKIAHGVSDLAGYAAVDEGEAAGVLQRLTAERIVRASSENGPSTTRYEIFHDVLADAVLAWRTRFEADRRIEEERREHRRRQRRLIVIGALALLGLAIMTAVTAYALAQRSNAQHQAAVAETQRAKADQGQAEAKKQTNIANQQTAKANEKTKEAQQAEASAKSNEHKAKAAKLDALAQKAVAEGNEQEARRFERLALAERDKATAQSARAESEKRKAVEARLVAQRRGTFLHARALAASARALLDRDPEKSVQATLAALQAFRAASRAPDEAVENTLRQGILALRLKAVLPGDGKVEAARYSPDGKQILLAGEGGAWIFERVSGSRVQRLRSTRQLLAAGSGFRVHRLRPAGQFDDATFSSDGRLVATGGGRGVAQVWDARTYMPLYSLRHDGPVLSIAFSPDNRLIATGSADGTARLWDASSGVALGTPFHHDPGQAGSDNVRMVSFSPDGKRLLTVGGDRFARVFDVAHQELVLRFNHVNQVFAARFSPDGKLIATVGANPIIRVWDAENDAAPLSTLTSGGARFDDVKFSPDGKLLAVASMNDTVAQVWNLELKTIITTVTRHLSGVESVVFHPRYALIATMGRDGIAYIARSSAHVHAALLGHHGRLNDAVFSPDGLELLTASDDRTARIWDARVDLIGPLPLANQHEVANLGAAVNTVAFSPDGKFSLAAAADGTARLYSGNRPVATLQQAAAVTAAAFSGNGRRVLTASADGTVRVWSTADRRPLVTFTHGAPVNAADLSRNGRFAVTAGNDGSAWLWNAVTGSRLHRLAHSGEVLDARFSPDGKLVVTASADGTAAVWRVATGAKISNLVGHTGRVVGTAFSPGGRWIATASADSVARIWNAETGELRWSLEGHTDRLTSLAFSHDGKWLATASVDQQARIWSVRTGNKVSLLQIHQGPVRAVEFSADDRWVATAGPTAVGVWQTRKRGGWPQNPLYLVRGPTRQVTDVAFSPRGWRIVFGSMDGSFRTFNCRLCGGLKELSAIARAKLHSIVRMKPPS
jgi:WD40 repeat protein